MTKDQIVLFTLLGFVFVFLVWGRWRYDIVAFCALLVALIAGVVPSELAFSGFGHPATVIIALVLIVSRGLSNSGAVELVARYVVDSSRSVSAHIGILAGVGAALSAVMNNVGALALLMPVDLQAASNAKRSPALTLMPLSFATILGGMVTLIGTPPNIIIASFRAEALGEPYHMFDFAPVGGVCAVVGVLFVMLIGWRLIPADRAQHDAGKELFDLQDYIAEVHVPEGSPVIGKRVRELDEEAEEADGAIVGLSQGYSATVVLVLLMVITMTLSDVMNNTATAVIAAPIAIEIAARLNVNPDPFLMAVAVAASAAFLTPIGHKNNTLIMGPGGYRFGDYWRMGLPLEVLIITVGIPTILWAWPL